MFLLKFSRMKFFLIHPGNWNIFLEGLKVLMKGKASQVIKIFSFSFIFQVLQMLLLFQYCTSNILMNITAIYVKAILQRKTLIYVKLGVTWSTYTNMIMQQHLNLKVFRYFGIFITS